MPTEITYTHARANLAALCSQVASSREPVIIRRRGAEDAALVDAAELRSLTETAHLLRSPKNAQRLIAALVRASRTSRLRRSKPCGGSSTLVKRRKPAPVRRVLR
jgi:antitoxin YefM